MRLIIAPGVFGCAPPPLAVSVCLSVFGILFKQTKRFSWKQFDIQHMVHVCVCACACVCSIHRYSLVCLTTGPQPLPNRVLCRMRSSASFFNSQHRLFSLRLSSSCLRLLPRLVTCILPSIFPSVTCFRRLFLRKM